MTIVWDKEARRLWAIQYRKDNAEKLKQRHLDRMANDPEYVSRYKAKVEKRRLKYQESHKDEAEARKQLRASLAESKKVIAAQKAVERARAKRANLSDEDRLKRNEYARHWRNLNKDRINSENRDKLRTNAEHAEKLRERDRLRYAQDPEGHRNTMLTSKYGISLAEYQRMYAEQNGRCLICGNEKPPQGKSGLVVDHCHKDGHVRGLLCTFCNKGIGLMQDSIENLQRAIQYLKG
jgi:hypothetical protein